MLLIFVGSTDLLSSGRTSRVIGPVLRWLVPSISDSTIRQVEFVVRKCGHITEYAILAILFWQAIAQTRQGTVSWNWSIAIAALCLATLYAISDEFHQSFVSTRQGSALDVLIDATGAAIGLAAYRLWRKRSWKRIQCPSV